MNVCVCTAWVNLKQSHQKIDWCCFYYFVQNGLVALLEALCARIFSLDSWISVFLDIFFVCARSRTKPRVCVRMHNNMILKLIRWCCRCCCPSIVCTCSSPAGACRCCQWCRHIQVFYCGSSAIGAHKCSSSCCYRLWTRSSAAIDPLHRCTLSFQHVLCLPGDVEFEKKILENSKNLWY